MRDSIFPHKYILPAGQGPKFPKLLIVEKYIGSCGRVGPVNQVINASVEEQGGPIRVKKH